MASSCRGAYFADYHALRATRSCRLRRRRARSLDRLDRESNVAGAVAATNHHLSAIEERLMIEAPPEKLAIDFRTLFTAAE